MFAIGNAVTGKGNINESVKHSREISSGIAENILEWQQQEYQAWHRQTTRKVDRDMDRIIGRIGSRQPVSGPVLHAIMNRVNELQKKAGYSGNYREWIREHLPVRHESMMQEGQNKGMVEK